MTKLYYTPPSDQEFEEVKKASMQLWEDVDTDKDAYGYATEKKNRIKDITNVEDNFMYMVAMFDDENQALLAEKLSPETRKAIRERMIDGGNPEYLIHF
jgi:DNA-binding MltR family transcriptional regulator